MADRQYLVTITREETRVVYYPGTEGEQHLLDTEPLTSLTQSYLHGWCFQIQTVAKNQHMAVTQAWTAFRHLAPSVADIIRERVPAVVVPTYTAWKPPGD